jgi:Flp pilus assembly protein TadG
MRSPIINLPSKLSLVNKRKQKGAVAIIFGLTAAVLLSMGGLVVDMGHLFIAKTELQNAADAAALAGAKRLDETAAGITNARNDAITIAALNRFNFATPVVITEANTEFSSNPAGPWLSYATALASPTGMTFVRVNTGARTLDTYLMSIAEIYTTATFGAAVAGRFVNNVTPIGICAINPNRGGTRPTTPAGTDEELTEFGFRRGVSYNVFELGPLGGPSDTYLLNPINVYPGAGSPSTCDAANSSANTTAPFICSGTSAVLVTTPGTVYGNSGISAGKIQAALNSRFDDYLPPSVCIAAQAPPDANIRPYPCTTGADCATANTTSASLPNTWMDPSSTTTPNSRQTFNLNSASFSSLNDYGVLWSYSRAVKAVGTSPNATPGAPFTPADWTKLYPAPFALSAEAAYPGGLTGTTGSPYLEPSSSDYFRLPINPGVAKRRVLNLAIANCGAVTGTGACKVIPVLGIGRFFMQVPADFSGGTKKLEVEFAGLIEPVPVSEIKLYR